MKKIHINVIKILSKQDPLSIFKSTAFDVWPEFCDDNFVTRLRVPDDTFDGVRDTTTFLVVEVVVIEAVVSLLVIIEIQKVHYINYQSYQVRSDCDGINVTSKIHSIIIYQ